MEDRVAAEEVHFGTVASLKKSFGFLKSPSLVRQVFFHRASCACPLDSINIGDVFRFCLDSSQAPGKLVAISLMPVTDKHAGHCVTVADMPSYGIIQTPPRGPGHACNGLLRYMHEKEVRHLVFSTEDISAASLPLARRDCVRFLIATDHVKQAAAESSDSNHKAHAAQKAAQVAVISAKEKVGSTGEKQFPGLGVCQNWLLVLSLLRGLSWALVSALRLCVAACACKR